MSPGQKKSPPKAGISRHRSVKVYPSSSAAKSHFRLSTFDQHRTDKNEGAKFQPNSARKIDPYANCAAKINRRSLQRRFGSGLVQKRGTLSRLTSDGEELICGETVRKKRSEKLKLTIAFGWNYRFLERRWEDGGVFGTICCFGGQG